MPHRLAQEWSPRRNVPPGLPTRIRHRPCRGPARAGTGPCRGGLSALYGGPAHRTDRRSRAERLPGPDGRSQRVRRAADDRSRGDAAVAGETPSPTSTPGPTDTPEPTVPPCTDCSGRVNILLIGVDSGRANEATFNTDTMIVVSVDPTTHKVALISLPRDTGNIPLVPGRPPRTRTAGSTPARSTRCTTPRRRDPTSSRARTTSAGTRR